MMIVAPGTTSVRLVVDIYDDAGLPVTGLVAATFPAVSYARAGEAAVSVTLSDLAAIDSAYSSGGVKEYSGGRYRLDAPDSAFATASAEVAIIGEATNKRLVHPRIAVAYLESNVQRWRGGTPNTLSDGKVQAVMDQAGTGNRTISGTVDDGTDPIQGAVVIAKLNGIERGRDTTDADGNYELHLNDGTYLIVITEATHTFTPEELVVTSDATGVDYSMSAVVVTPSDDPIFATGWLFCRDSSGNLKPGVVITLRLVAGPGQPGRALDNGERTATSNAGGLVEFTRLFCGSHIEIKRGEDGSWERGIVPSVGDALLDANGTFPLDEVLGTEA